ncbi:imelysin family protein [Aliiroseovarius sediminis]|uniref:imelysin family protein n=1 Tax=Aliiroseovarius sediminis TaxID=2925839 RepID=UPI001F5AA0F1|nr:imelysin family protein [Aliiroseovarius sediminis]MCI2394254.1 imelysin family protein [Aliiroseovarius sediminis]
MKRLIPLAIVCLMPAMAMSQNAPSTPDHKAVADRVLSVLDHQFGTFRDHASALSDQAALFCKGSGTREGVVNALADTWTAWAPLDAYQFGPIEAQAAALTVNFFPDKKNFVGRALSTLLKQPESEQGDPAVIAASSAGVQGLPAIERLLFEDLQTCPALIGITGNLARIGSDLYTGWFAPDGWAALVQTAGPNNPVYLSPEEFTRQIYTALGFSIQRLRDHRIGRPLGSYERNFPKRAEAWRSGLTNEILRAQLAGLAEVVENGFATAIPDASRTLIADNVADIETQITAIGATLPKALDNPQMRFRVESLQTRLTYLQTLLDQHVGAHLDVEAGFSAGDGD